MNNKGGSGLLYLSRADVVACEIDYAETIAAVEASFLAKASGQARAQPKTTLQATGRGAFHAKGGVVDRYAALKWYGYFPDNQAAGRPDFQPLILLNDAGTGLPLAVMDGTWISEVRTAAISAVAAKRLARPDARRLGFVACGAQARSHFEALAAVFDIASVQAFSRRPETAEAFAAWIRSTGCDASATDDPRRAVSDVDVVVTSVPHVALAESFLDAGWAAPGTFITMVDLGYSWRRETLPVLDLIMTDAFDPGGGVSGLNLDARPAADIADLVSGKVPGRRGPNERTALIFSGTGLADAAVARLAYERAIERGVGLFLPF
jgi:ornithine cyclodeaminase/alanine dehydrogenase